MDTTNKVIIVTFDHTMKTRSLTKTDISLTVEGVNSPYSVSWEAHLENSELIVLYSVSPLIVDGTGETMELRLLNLQAFVSENSLALERQLSFTFTLSKSTPSDFVDDAGNGAAYTFILALLISIAI